MKQEIILLYAGQYSMADEKTGEINRGTTVNYYFDIGLSALGKDRDGQGNVVVGQRPAKSTCDFDIMEKIKEAPALYQADFEMKIGSNMKPELKIVGLEYIGEVKMIAKEEKPVAAGQAK